MGLGKKWARSFMELNLDFQSSDILKRTQRFEKKSPERFQN